MNYSWFLINTKKIKSRSQWNSSEYWKKNKQTCWPVKIFFKNKGVLKTFLNEQKLKNFLPADLHNKKC